MLLFTAALAIPSCGHPATTSSPSISEAPESETPTPSVPVKEAVPLGTAVEVSTPAGSAVYTVGNWRAVPVEAQIIPATGAMYSVDVTIEAKSGTVVYNGFYFAARIANGGSVAPSVGAVRPGITSGQLSQGQSVSGHVAFNFAPGTAVSGVSLRDPAGKVLAVWAVTG